jgi:hypothetical protein
MMFPNRLTHAGAVDVAGGVATLGGTLGGVASVVRNGAGDYTVTLKAPGVPGYAAHGLVPLALINSNFFAGIGCTMPAATTLRVFTWDAAGVALDASFSFALFTTERNGAAP